MTRPQNPKVKGERPLADLLSLAFVGTASGILLITGLAKLVSGFGTADVLWNIDPILKIQFRFVFWIVGGIELAIAVFCAFSKSVRLPAVIIAWLATSFIGYRLGLWLVGWRKPCPCLGEFTDALHISPQTADTAMIIILAYLFMGSYATLFWLWRQRTNAEVRMPNDEVKAEMKTGIWRRQ